MSSANGAICLDVLKDQWSPALTLKTALLSVQSLLASPEPKDPQDAVVARQYMAEHELFVRAAKQWTQQYANECVLPAATTPLLSRLTAPLIDQGQRRRERQVQAAGGDGIRCGGHPASSVGDERRRAGCTRKASDWRLLMM